MVSTSVNEIRDYPFAEEKMDNRQEERKPGTMPAFTFASGANHVVPIRNDLGRTPDQIQEV